MFKKIGITFKNLDWILLSSVALLSSFGLVEIYSIALSRGGDFTNFKKQAAFVVVGLLLLFLFAMADYNHLRSYWIYLFIIGFGLLLGVLFFGSVIRNTKGWFLIGPLSLQPVEFAKVVLCVVLSRYFSGLSGRGKNLKHILFSGAGVASYLILVLYQPDLGSALILLAIWVLSMFFAGVKMRLFSLLTLILLVVLAFSWFFYFEDYQKVRIMTFLKPQSATIDQGYNVAQAAIAVGSGRWIGRGVGFGSQSQLKFLPEAQNDFIFAVISEELGFLGASLVLLFFGIIFFRLLQASRSCPDVFGSYLLAGAAGLIFTQMFVNIGMNIGLLPVIGISLPFLSYGGSAIIAFYSLIGIAQSVIVRSKLKY